MQEFFTRVAVYRDIDDARKTVFDLVDAGFKNEEISLIHRDAIGDYARAFEGSETPAPEGDVAEGAGAGALAGGIVGLLAGAALLAIPGIGPVLAAGPLAGALAGGAAGAAGGAAIGVLVENLVDQGLSRDEAQLYAEALRRGGALVAVTTTHDADQLERILMRRAVDMQSTEAGWRERGWKGFEPEAEPYPPEDLDPDLEFYNR